MKVSVFGGALPKPGQPSYQEAYALGRLLGEAGHTVLTGGYIGVMEAASRGCAEHGGHVIGVTCDEIENWRRVRPNAYVKEEMRFKTLNERLNALILNCDAAVALPGGIGTLTEIALFWNQMAIDVLPVRPLVVVGEGWQATFEKFISGQESYIAPKDQLMLSYAADAEQAFALIQKYAALRA